VLTDQSADAVSCADNSARGVAAVYRAIIPANQASTPGIARNAAGGKAILDQRTGFVVTGNPTDLVAGNSTPRSGYAAHKSAGLDRSQIVAHNSTAAISITNTNGSE